MQISIDPSATQAQVAIVTGPSGAGRSTAIHALEDLGFEAIDNLPLPLLERLLSGDALERPLAIGVDARTRGFSAGALEATLDALSRDPRLDVSLVFMDCATDILLRRFSETRRRHPLAPRETPLSGIGRELEILEPLRARADVVIDTTDLSPHDLRALVGRRFGNEAAPGLSVSVQSFSYKRSTPRGADMVLDCRFLRNPHWAPELRPLTGVDGEVAAYVREDALYEPFVGQTVDLLALLLPAYKAEGKAYFSVAFGCTGGRHRSVTIAEAVANRLAQAGWHVSIRHRELERAPHEGAAGEVVGQ